MVTVDTETKLRLLRLLLESRLGETREQNLLRQGRGHFQINAAGHEGVAALGLHLRKDDYLFPFYRDRALCLSKGMTTAEFAGLYLAKAGSESGGRAMPGHFSHRASRIWSHPSPTGSHLLPGCGAAWGLQMEKSDAIVVATVGDGATRQGDFFEAICFARERKLPYILLVEDNGYGISTPSSQMSPLRLRGVDPTLWEEVDGCDVLDFYARSEEWVRRCRSGEGPVFVWARVERLMSHSSSDDQRGYRPAEELSALPGKCPLDRLKQHLLEEGAITAEEIETLETQVREEVREVYRQVDAGEDPVASTVNDHVFGELPASREKLLEPGRYRIADAFNKILGKALVDEPKTLLFGEDIEDPKGGVFKLTKNLSSEFPGRVCNSPLAESTILGVACGLASTGWRPVFEVQFIDFITPGFNQLVANLATLRWRSNGQWKCPCVIYAPYGAYLPAGGMWHSQSNESWFAHTPGLRVVVPSTPEDAAGLLWSATKADDPVLFLLPKHLIWAEREVKEPLKALPLGKARTVRKGSDITLVAWGNTVELAEQAAEKLAAEASVEVLDLRTLVPWDRESVVQSLQKTGRLVVVQEDIENASVGQMIVSSLVGDAEIFARLSAPPQLVSRGNTFVGYNPVCEYAALPDLPRLEKALRASLAAESPDRPAPAPVSVAKKTSPAPAKKKKTAAKDSSGETETVLENILVPNLGEGVYEATVVSLDKQVGDRVELDDVLCEVETDKAVFPIESRVRGVLVEWKAEVDGPVKTGEVVCVIEAEKTEELTRAGEGYHVFGSGEEEEEEPEVEPKAEEISSEHPLVPPALPPAVTARLQGVVETNIVVKARYEALRAARRQAKATQAPGNPSPSVMSAWCILQAMNDHPSFRRLILDGGRFAQPTEFDLGIAVALEDDRLETAVVPNASRLGWGEFVARYQQAVTDVRAGKRASKAGTPLIVTSMGALGVRFGMPIVVPPAMATLFVGTSHIELVATDTAPEMAEVVTLSLTFDHRLANGAGAASFIGAVRERMETFELPAE